jgi:pimeloyl-ACP methyl ester carboxylesterase
MKVEPITGRYGELEIEGVAHRLYWEEAGEGVPLLCLHTAGADGRQWRAVLNDPEITRDFRVIAYDMPWHGKSSPPPGAQAGEYRLTSNGYVAQILAVCDALELERPVVMGCSIGGRIVLHLARDHPERFGGLVGLQSSAAVDPYYDTSWLHRADVHGGEVCGAVAYGLCAPMSPAEHVDETVWHYRQGGPGVFKGDLFFYKQDGDIRDRVAEIDPAAVPIRLLTGEYDYSCRPEDTRQVAEALGLEMAEMPGLGHFPMSENPARFLEFLRPALAEIRAARGG